jgi:catechol 2,3-dioxygenase-like lactoylglutathione lyase family enzyme
MKVRLLIASVIATALTPGPGLAQLAPPGGSGVVMGHIHLLVRDVDVQRRFWTALGGTPVQNGPLQLIQLPGVFVMLRQGQPSGGTGGSVINHVGFTVRDLKESQTRWQAAGIAATAGRLPSYFITGPDDVRIEIIEDTAMTEPIRLHHLHWSVVAPLEMQAWYGRHFGAVPGKRAQFDAADLPGVNLTFGGSETPAAPLKGRSLDHIGFEVRNLERLIATLEKNGARLDQPFRRLPETAIGIAFLTDPWGTYIELTENLAPAK